MRRFLLLMVLGGLALAFGPSLAAGPVTGGFPRLDGSARGTALGGNLVALAEGADAISWNAAGLLSVSRREISLTYADLFGLGLVTQSGVQFAWPRLRGEMEGKDGRIERRPLPPPADRALGLTMHGLRGELGSDHYVELQGGVALAWSLPAGARTGVCYRFLSSQSGFRSTGGTGHAIDVGLQRDLGPIRIGLAAANLISTTNWKGDPGGTSAGNLSEPLAERWSAGLAWSARSWPVSVAVQGDWTGAGFAALQRGAGTEWHVHPLLALRGGFRQRQDILGWRGDWGAGAGLRVGGYRLDYAWQSNDHSLGETHRWTLGATL